MAKNNKAAVISDDDDEAPVTVKKSTPPVETKEPVTSDDSGEESDAPPVESKESKAAAKANKPVKVEAPAADEAGVRIQMLRTLEPGPKVGNWSAADNNIAAMKQNHPYIVPQHVADDLVSKGHAIQTA